MSNQAPARDTGHPRVHAPTRPRAASPAVALDGETRARPHSPADHAMGAGAAAHVAAALKALADPLRLRMLSIIAASPTGEACVDDLATVASVSQPTVSHHLRLLKDAGLLTAERRGTWVYYRVQPALRGPVTTLLDSFAPVVVDAVATVRARSDGGDGSTDGTAPPADPSDAASGGDADDALTVVADRLGPSFPDLDPGTILGVVRESYTGLARRAGARAHLVHDAERFARQRLTDAARTLGGPAAARRPQVLFVCVANAGRSQLAAALLRHHAGDAVTVRSAGSMPAPDVHAAVLPLLAELGADAEAFPKPLTDDAVRAADVVVTMGCGDVCPVLPGRRYEDWAVGDPALASEAGARAIRDEIDRQVRRLLADLLPDPPRPASRPAPAPLPSRPHRRPETPR